MKFKSAADAIRFYLEERGSIGSTTDAVVKIGEYRTSIDGGLVQAESDAMIACTDLSIILSRFNEGEQTFLYLYATMGFDKTLSVFDDSYRPENGGTPRNKKESKILADEYEADQQWYLTLKQQGCGMLCHRTCNSWRNGRAVNSRCFKNMNPKDQEAALWRILTKFEKALKLGDYL